MTSRALRELRRGLDEVQALQRSNPTPAEGGGLDRKEITRALGRAEVVLLCSHLERYIYSLHEEAVDFLIAERVLLDRVPVTIRLLDAREAFDDVAQTNWDRREAKLRDLATHEAADWLPEAIAQRIRAERLLSWMKTPSPQGISRAFMNWGIGDVFSAITRTRHHRARIWLKIDELTQKRNNIAHGDFTTEATYLDVRSYLRAVKDFSSRADTKLAEQLRRISGGPTRPW